MATTSNQTSDEILAAYKASEERLYKAVKAMIQSLRSIGIVLVKDAKIAEEALKFSTLYEEDQEESTAS